jgi:hypothetical protein
MPSKARRSPRTRSNERLHLDEPVAQRVEEQTDGLRTRPVTQMLGNTAGALRLDGRSG